jgi:hypothetical protein
MRNYRELTTAEVNEIAKLYPVKPNRVIARQYDISVDALQDYLAYPNGWTKDRKAVLIGNRGGQPLTDKQVQWIVKHYQHTKNDDIMTKFRIGESTLHRIARKYGLKKSRQQQKKTQWNATCHAHEVCRKYGVYEETRQRMKQQAEERKARGERIPGSFMPGESNKDRLGASRFKKCIEKATATMREIRRKERVRLHWGLPQKTRLNISFNGYTPAMKKKATHRYLFRQHGYIVERGSDTMYYDENTKRNAIMERNAAKYGLKIEEL